MHDTALEYGGLFFKTYTDNGKSIKVLDLGSQDVNGSLRTVAPKKAEYVGVDFADGKGVDVKITDPYALPFDDESIDIVVSSSCFEHSEFFWLTFLELIRILKPSGFLYINAPSNGNFHRYPVDCWRFYPDAGIALEHWAIKNGYKDVALVESFIGVKKNDLWNDFVAVFIKSQELIPLHNKKMIDQLDSYTNGYIFGNKEIIKFEEFSDDHLKNKASENRVRDIEKSISWRITKPLRSIKQILKFIK